MSTVVHVKETGGSDRTREASSPTLKPVELKVDIKNGFVDGEDLESKTVEQPAQSSAAKDVPPEFIIKPRRQFVDEGESTKFKTSFEGSSNTKVIWKLGGKEITPDAHYKIFQKDDFHYLEINDVLPEHGGSYTCVLQNPAGSQSTTMDLEVFEKPKPAKVAPPTLLKPLEDQLAALGARDTKLQCTVSDASTATVIWLKDGKELRQGRQHRIRFDGRVAYLGLTTATQADCGLYECVIKNNGGEVRTSCTLTVESEKREPPYFVRELEDMEVDDGDKVELVVEVKGSEPIDLFWIHNNKEIARDDTDYQQYSLGGNVFKLIIGKVVPGDAGTFVCEAYNDFGDTDTYCNVSIREIEKSQPPDFIIKPKLTKVSEGESAVFTCSVDGIPPPQVYWERNGKILQNEDKYQISQNHNKHTLVITKATKEDGGKYVCRLDNQMVSMVHSTSLIVHEKTQVSTTDYRSVLKKRASLGTIGQQSSSDSEKSDKENDRRVFHNFLSRMDDSSLKMKPLGKESHSALKTKFEENSTKDRIPPVIKQAQPNGTKANQNGNTVQRATAEVKPFFQSKTSILDKKPPILHQTNDNFQKNPFIANDKVSQTSVVRPLPKALDIRVDNNFGVSGNLKAKQSKADVISLKKDSIPFKSNHPTKQIELDKMMDFKSSKPKQIDFRNVLKSKDQQKKNEKPNETTSVAPSKDFVDFRTVLTNNSTVRKMSLDSKVKDNVFVQHDFRSVLSNKSEHKEKPKFKQKLSNQRVRYGGEAVLVCTVEGTPQPEINWKMNNKEIKHSRYFRLKYENNIASLTISEAFSEDEGEYVVTASNPAGTCQTSCHLQIEESSSLSSRSDSRSIEGSVAFPAKILNVTPTDVSATKGKSTEIKATFNGEPQPTIRWFKFKHELESDGKNEIKTSANSSILTINNLQLADAGQYSIKADNELGLDTVSISISVEDVPYPPMGRPFVSDVSKSSVSLSWYGPAYDGGSQITGYCIEYCKGNSRKWQTSNENCRNTFYQPDNLESGTQYLFRVKSMNKHGISEPGETSELVTTLDDHSVSMDYESDGYSEVFSPEPVSNNEDELPFEPRYVTIDKNRKFEDLYQTLDEIGRGKFGNVYKCKEKDTGKIWAAKILKCREKEKPNIRKEIEIMNKLTHPKVLMLWDAFEAQRSMILVMEYIQGGELFERVSSDDFELTERDVIHFMRQICNGVAYMNKANIIHLDLKPENILCISKDSNQIKIIDFGLAQYFEPGQEVKVLFGTPEFIAPEVVNYEEISFATDMWSVGVICYVLLSGLSPFLGDSDNETLSNVTLGEYDFDDEAFDEISENAKEFIQNLLIKNKRRRATVDQCLNHVWLKQDERRIRCKRLNTEKLRHFMARRKWQTSVSSPLSNDEESSFSFNEQDQTASTNHSAADTSTDFHSSPEEVFSPPTIKKLTSATKEPKSNLSSKLRESKLELLAKKYSLDDLSNDNNNYKDFVDDKESSSSAIIDRPFAKPEVRSSHSGKKCEQNDFSHSARLGNTRGRKGDIDVEFNKIDLNKKDSPNDNPRFVKEMVDCEAFSGDVIRFDVVVSEHSNISWYYEDEAIIEDSRHIIDFGVNGRCSLIIRQVTEEDEGEYTCKATSKDGGEAVCSAELIVCGSSAI